MNCARRGWAAWRAPSNRMPVFFGATGDLAFKQVFSALNPLVNRDGLAIPIIGMGAPGGTSRSCVRPGAGELGWSVRCSTARRTDRRLFSLERDFLRQPPDRPLRTGPGAQALAGLHRRQELSAGLRRTGAVRLRHFAVVLRARSIRRALPSGREIAGALDNLGGVARAHGLHSVRTLHPLLQLSLDTRILGASGWRYRATCSPAWESAACLSCQAPSSAWIGFTPIQSGLMIMPQALAAISFKFTLPAIREILPPARC